MALKQIRFKWIQPSCEGFTRFVSHPTVDPCYVGDNFWSSCLVAGTDYSTAGSSKTITNTNRVNGDYVCQVSCSCGGCKWRCIIDTSEDGGVIWNQKHDTGYTLCRTNHYNYTVGRQKRTPDGTPTYLETLDKLDQWSSAQYIPDVRNSGNKLNL